MQHGRLWRELPAYLHFGSLLPQLNHIADLEPHRRHHQPAVHEGAVAALEVDNLEDDRIASDHEMRA